MISSERTIYTARELADELAGVLLDCLDDSLGDLSERDGPDEIKIATLAICIRKLVRRNPALESIAAAEPFAEPIESEKWEPRRRPIGPPTNFLPAQPMEE